MLSGAVDSGEVLDPLSLVFKTEKTIQCVIFVVSTSKRQQAAENCYSQSFFHFTFTETQMRWIIVSEREFSLSFSKINKPSNSKSVTCFFFLRSLENSTILNKNNTENV